MEKFKQLGLSSEVLSELARAGFEVPSEIQEKVIPLALQGKDIIGGSATGSGKTLAFSAPILENVTKNSGIQALVLTPTRELAEQISESIKKFSKNKKLEITAIYGGVDIKPQIRKLLDSEVVIATPGRLLDHIERKTIRLDEVKILVLDEVDRMFDMGFQKDVEKIINLCPKERQTLLFSATISSEIDYLAKKYTRNAVEISVESHVDPSKLSQIYYDVPDNEKFSLLVHLLKNEDAELVMVFCSTRRNVDFVANNLKSLKIQAQAIHGGLAQNKRNSILEKFHSSTVEVLVCTDVAARGLDIKGVTHVYNYDIPKTSKEYIHRVGRTARAGEKGKAINILSSRDYDNFGKIIKEDSSLNIVPEEIPKFERVFIRIDTNKRRNFKRFEKRNNNFSRKKNSYSRKSRRY